MATNTNFADAFRSRMEEHLAKNNEVKAHEDTKIKEEAQQAFTAAPEAVAGDNQVMFSDLTGIDVKALGRPDFPVDTFWHEHENWPDEIKALVPERDPDYMYNPLITYRFMAGDNRNVFLVGDPGSGKTTLPKEMAALTGRPMFKQSFSHDLEKDEWIASKEITDKGTEWNILDFVKTLRYPTYAVLDEFNRLHRGGRLLMNRLLDIGGTLQLPDGSEVRPDKNWRAIATDNTRGLGDGLDKFEGDVADISTTDRFGMMIEVPYLAEKAQRELVSNWVPELDKKIVAHIVKFGIGVAAAYKKGTLPLPWTPRRMRACAELSVMYRNPVHALYDVYYSFLAEDKHRQLCNQLLVDTGLAKMFNEFD